MSQYDPTLSVLGIPDGKKWHYDHYNDIGKMIYPNLLNQDFKDDRPNQKWAADMTYVLTKSDG